MSLDNIDVAILTKLNELADRFCVKPYDFIATIEHGLEMDGCGLTFVIPTEASDQQRGKVEKMLESLGVSMEGDKKRLLKGGEIKVIDDLDRALQNAPRPLLGR